MPELSVIIPNRNSPFTTQTINDVLKNAGCDVEVIVNVDENWPTPLVEDARVHYIHPSSPIGLRQAINTCVKMAKGKYIMKTDDHCAFGENFGRILIDNHAENNWVQIPRRYALDAENWKIGNEGDSKYPVDYMYLDFPRKGKEHDDGMHGVPYKREGRDDILIDDTPSMQGSCYFMTKDHFENFLGGLSEVGYGQFSQESQEIGFKTWLGGGAVKVNKKTFYCHLHKGRVYGRMYQMPGGTAEASNWSADHWLNDREPNMIHKFEWFIDEKFPGMPKWDKDWQLQIKQMGWTS
jgi:glycosyltransferase involved in cell wall biosynthesis